MTTPTDAPDRLELRATDASRNIRRRYEVRVARDLFGAWLVETSWGRVGAAGQGRCEAFDSREAAEACARRHLRRRASAVRRIGTPYLPVASPEPAWAAPGPGTARG